MWQKNSITWLLKLFVKTSSFDGLCAPFGAMVFFRFQSENWELRKFVTWAIKRVQSTWTKCFRKGCGEKVWETEMALSVHKPVSKSIRKFWILFFGLWKFFSKVLTPNKFSKEDLSIFLKTIFCMTSLIFKNFILSL